MPSQCAGARPLQGQALGYRQAGPLRLRLSSARAYPSPPAGIETANQAARKRRSFQMSKQRKSLRIRAKNPQISDQVAVNYRKADITPRQRAMLDFAMKVSTEAHKISEADFTAVASHGFSDDDIWDIAAISAFFALSNRMANVTAMRPNDEFYMMGRLPK